MERFFHLKKMKKLVLFLAILNLCSCTDSNPKTSTPLFVKSKKVCPKGNPYSYGGGHYAGYEWGQNNDVSSCGGNNSSFIEGCEEYLRQQDCNEDE